VGVVVVINEFRDRVVVGSRHHSGWRFFWLNYRFDYQHFMWNQATRACLTSLLIEWPFSRVGTVRSNHLLRFGTNAHSLHDLEILHARQNLVLDLELDLHAELGTLFNREGLGFESLQLARLAQVDNDIWTTLDLKKVRSGFGGVYMFESYLKT
jgi:hypothetical protein